MLQATDLAKTVRDPYSIIYNYELSKSELEEDKISDRDHHHHITYYLSISIFIFHN